MGADTDWRGTVAARLAASYARSPRVAAVTIAGSVGTGLADQWSDLELDCYWRTAPSDIDRTRPIDDAGGKVDDLWDYDADEQEWSEDYHLGPLAVTVSNFTVATVESFLDDVLAHDDLDPVKHMRLAAIQNCRVVAGHALLTGWRHRMSSFPETLRKGLIARALTPTILAGWPVREALVERGDTIAVRALLSRIEQAIAEALLALNGRYRPHRTLKWQTALLADLPLAPADVLGRLDDMWTHPPARAIEQAQTLLAELLALITLHTTADVAEFQDELATSRAPVSPPPATPGEIDPFARPRRDRVSEDRPNFGFHC